MLCVFCIIICNLLTTVSHRRSVSESSGSGLGVRRYSGDQFESSSGHMQPATSDRQSSDKLHSTAGASQKADQTTRRQQNEDHSQHIDDGPVLSHTHSGNAATSFSFVGSCFLNHKFKSLF